MYEPLARSIPAVSGTSQTRVRLSHGTNASCRMVAHKIVGHLACWVRAAIIDDHNLPVGESLGDDALDGLGQELSLLVARIITEIAGTVGPLSEDERQFFVCRARHMPSVLGDIQAAPFAEFPGEGIRHSTQGDHLCGWPRPFDQVRGDAQCDRPRVGRQTGHTLSEFECSTRQSSFQGARVPVGQGLRAATGRRSGTWTRRLDSGSRSRSPCPAN